MDKQIEEQLVNLMQVYGAEKVKHAAEKLITEKLSVAVTFDTKGLETVAGILKEATSEISTAMDTYAGISVPEIPKKYEIILSEQQIAATIDGLDEVSVKAVEFIENEASPYMNKAQLLRDKAQLEADIKLTEATAIMQATSDGTLANLKNETQRDAFRRQASAEKRTALARIEGELQAIDATLAQERDERTALQIAAESLQRRAQVQSALLAFLGGTQ